ncbi:MAG: hypothetical protein Q9195_005993 [Heterodermia aff. obscurata]
MDEYCDDEARHRALLTMPLKLPQETSMSDNLAVFEISTANICVSESDILIVMKTHSDSSEYNEAKNVTEKAQTLSEITAVDDDLPSSEKSTHVESSRPECSDSGSINTKSSRRIVTKSKRYAEDQVILISSDSGSDKNQISAPDSSIRKRRKLQKDLTEKSSVFKMPKFSTHHIIDSKPATRRNHQPSDVAKYDMNYHPLDEFIRPESSTKKAAGPSKEQSERELTSIDIKSEILRLNRQIGEVMIECDKMRALAEKQMKILGKLVFKLTSISARRDILRDGTQSTSEQPIPLT